MKAHQLVDESQQRELSGLGGAGVVVSVDRHRRKHGRPVSLEIGHCPGVPQLIEAVSLGVRCCRHSLNSRRILAGIESLEQRTQRRFWNWWMEKSVIEETVLP